MKLTYPYYFLLLASFIYSLYFLHYKMVKVLAILFFLSIATEVLAEIGMFYNQNIYIYYTWFTLAEYVLVTIILYQCVRNKLWKYAMLVSIPVFGMFCGSVLLFLQTGDLMPTIDRGLEGILVIIWCVRAFYDMEVDNNETIFQQAGFWFIMAFYSYYCIITPYNSVYNILQADKQYKELSHQAYELINNLANYLLYILCIIGLSCLKRARSTQQLSSSR